MKKSSVFYFLLWPSLFLVVLLTGSCSSDSIGDNNPVTKPKNTQTFFRSLPSTKTGIDFSNNVIDRNDFNILTYRNFYNGGGVAIGDINNDQLPDIYFTSNLEKNQLYLNKGNFIFENITKKAKVAGAKSWSTGVTMADVNGDGWLDIYVCNSGDLTGDNKENELFINNGDQTFTESAQSYGLNNSGYSTQAAFFDYDVDGDLDCYLLNNSFKDPGKIELYRSMRDTPDALGGDRLYRNDDGHFTNVSQSAGIYSSAIGFGLGTCIGDINQDHLPDIYVSNDFWERDYLYINKGDGTFSEELIGRINFSSISSMGGDIADLNNDGYPEIISTDMLAADNYRLKAMSAFDPYHLEDIKYRANYHYQIGQNCLHLNDGQGRFQEIGMMANVAATDWSWGALIFDFENDGRKDLFVSNGIQRDLMYMDFRDFMQDEGLYIKKAKNEIVDYPGLISKMPSYPLKNYAFTNNGHLKFEDKAQSLGLADPSFSNGAAYGDLDNDGDLDLVVNNINAPAFIYQNEANKTKHHHLKIQFEGYSKNPFGIGAQVKITTERGIQTLQNYNTRGFQSSIEPLLIFGLGEENKVNKLEVVWPDHKMQVLMNIDADRTITLIHQEANDISSKAMTGRKMFNEVGKEKIIGDSKHTENRYNDFDHERLLVSMLSKESPRILKGDINGNSREDIIVLGAKDDADKLFVQKANGTFERKSSPHFEATKEFESDCGVLFDGDNDGDLDLMLGAGGNEYERGTKYFILRYYKNDGDGNFLVDNSNIPQIIGNFSCIEAADTDKDGDVDLFFGGRVVPGNYGLPPRSFLMINDRGTWKDATPESLAGVGMVTDANWTDIDNDGDKDLIVVGDWMEINIFKNQNGQLDNSNTISNSSGWWNRIEAADLDNDGDMDFVIGNRGLNSKFQASVERPLSMYVSDFDNNGKSEFIINWYPPANDKSYPFASKGDLIGQLPGLRKSNLKYEDYAKQTYRTLFANEQKDAAIAYSTVHLASSILWNEGDSFSLQSLPKEAQVSPVYGIAIDDLNGDGQSDIWVGGNLYALQPQVGRHDASRGVLLIGKNDRSFENMPPSESGIYVEGEVRDATVIKNGDVKSLVIARNDLELLMYQKSDH